MNWCRGSRATDGADPEGDALHRHRSKARARTMQSGPRRDALVEALGKYIIPYVRPANEDDEWRVGPGGALEDERDRGGVRTGMIDVVDGMVCMGVIDAETTEVLFEDVMGWDYDYNFNSPDGGCP